MLLPPVILRQNCKDSLKWKHFLLQRCLCVMWKSVLEAPSAAVWREIPGSGGILPWI